MLTAKPRIIKPNFSLVTGPASEPVSTSDFEAQKRVTLDASEFDKVTGFLTAAREMAEQYTRRAFVTQTWQASFSLTDGSTTGRPFVDYMTSGSFCAPDAMPRAIELARPPLVSVDSIVYYTDGSDTPATFASSNYQVSTIGYKGRVMLRTGSVWPSALRPMDSIVITYTAGYGSASDVPMAIKEAILEWAAHWYENREGQQAPNVGGAVVLDHGGFIPGNVRAKLNTYVVSQL